MHIYIRGLYPKTEEVLSAANSGVLEKEKIRNKENRDEKCAIETMDFALFFYTPALKYKEID